MAQLLGSRSTVSVWWPETKCVASRVDQTGASRVAGGANRLPQLDNGAHAALATHTSGGNAAVGGAAHEPTRRPNLLITAADGGGHFLGTSTGHFLGISASLEM